jgi:hypothetical protein
LPGLRRHSLWKVECPGHGCGMHPGPRCDIEDCDSLRMPHTTRPYTGGWARRLDR